MTFPIRTFSSSNNETVTGEFVTETSTAYQIAVNGEVRVLLKAAWTPNHAGAGKSFEDMFGGMFR